MSEHAHNPARVAAPGSARALRIGLVLGGKIVEEKVIRERREITIGQAVKNTLVVPMEGMPRAWALFRHPILVSP